MEATGKITPQHLSRNAYLYVRQSTIRQVVENTESTRRQYDLRRLLIYKIIRPGFNSLFRPGSTLSKRLVTSLRKYLIANL